jgi:hypothetical protein
VPRYGSNYLSGEWCWTRDGFETPEEPASLIDKYLKKQRDAIVKGRQVVLPNINTSALDDA